MALGIRPRGGGASAVSLRCLQSFFAAYGEQDQLIPPERAHAARKFLEGAGYPLRFKGYRMGHEISPEVIADLRAWLGEVLGATRQGQ